MRLKDDLKLFHVGHDYFIVDMNTDMVDMTHLYAMNEATAFLWEEFHDKEFTLDEMAARLCEAYDVEADTARRDVDEMLKTWNEYGMIA